MQNQVQVVAVAERFWDIFDSFGKLVEAIWLLHKI